MAHHRHRFVTPAQEAREAGFVARWLAGEDGDDWRALLSGAATPDPYEPVNRYGDPLHRLCKHGTEASCRLCEDEADYWEAFG